MNQKFENIMHECDFCVVGAGLSGMCAAIAAARHGLSVVLMNDRPMFGGNASSEIRMWICGARGDNNKETGILEDISLENIYKNPYRTYPLWDEVLFDSIKKEENITYILNCSCNDCVMDGNKIVSVTGWQLSTQKYHTVKAKYFADCSGDSVLAPITGAEFRMGRECKTEFGESLAQNAEDSRTMGLSCLMQARETDSKRPFIPPEWARKFTKETLSNRVPMLRSPYENFWYLELGGMQNTIDDSEEIRDDLLAVAYGIWDYIKNSGDMDDVDNWELDFVGFLPGRRESRRYVGDYILSQTDIEKEGRFDDVVAYGGWTMDDHNPHGIDTTDAPNKHNPAPSPYGIPYRCLYSKNVENLFFAGRNISTTHIGMSSTRVMATCAILGQAVGTAAFVANENALSPRGVYENKIKELKQILMEDDCYLPFNKMEMSDIMKSAEIKADGTGADNLINGYDRPIGDAENCWSGKTSDSIEIKFKNAESIESIRFIFDSDLNRLTVGARDFLPDKNCLCNTLKNPEPVHMPKTLVKDFKIELLDENGEYTEFETVKDNRRRRVVRNIGRKCSGVKITPLETYGSDTVRIFSINIK